jgi:F-box protein 18 (helicase)
MIFSTVHSCKGMEYDAIQLVNDFISQEKLEKLKKDKNKELHLPKLNEEINLLYVAVTRTRNSIHIPQTLMPSDFPFSAQIHVIRVMAEEEKEEQAKASTKQQPFAYKNCKARKWKSIFSTCNKRRTQRCLPTLDRRT